jgi:hypothetical protein
MAVHFPLAAVQSKADYLENDDTIATEQKMSRRTE